MTKQQPQTARNPALEDRASAGARLFSPSAERNWRPIRDVFVEHMPATGAILEVGGGTGEHAVKLAEALPGVQWRTGDPDERARASIAAWIEAARLPNLSGPHAIATTDPDWGADWGPDWGAGEVAPLAGLVSINMIHIAPFAAAQGLFAGAQRLLAPGGRLFLYGPFSRNGVHTAPSNAAFDQSLKARDPAWGVRDLERDIAPLARNHALRLETIVEMPANNLAVIFSKP